MRQHGRASGTRGETETNTAFAAFYRAYYSDAVRWANGLLGSRTVGEKLVRDTLLAMSDRFGDIERPGAHLKRTIVTRAASWHRTGACESRPSGRAPAGDSPHYTPATTQMLDALRVLPYDQRAVVTLRYWANWTDRQIAETVGCAPSIVRVLLDRAMNALREELTS